MTSTGCVPQAKIAIDLSVRCSFAALPCATGLCSRCCRCETFEGRYMEVPIKMIGRLRDSQ
jgi:hypothetical protein